MSDIVENPEAYFRQFLPPRDRLLIDLEQEAQREDIPIVGPVVGELLFILAVATRAGRILELGAATGYSAIYMARALQSPGGRLVTLENDPAMAARAELNFQKAGLAGLITVITADALTQMNAMTDPFDFVFMDIDKEQYAAALPHCHRLLRPGGLLVADNVGFKEADPFNRMISEAEGWRQVSLFTYLPFHSPEKDGLCLALRV